MLPGYPFKERFLDRGGAKLHYLDEGAGDPVVALHGGISWSYFYRNLVMGLRGAWRVIAPDHIGFGLSDKPEGYDYALGSRVDELEALLDSLGITDRITLIMHDWSAAVGIAFAARAPRKIARLVILNSAAFPPPPGKTLPAFMRAARGLLGPLWAQWLNALASRAVAKACIRPLDEDVRRAYLAPYATRESRAALLRYVRDLPLLPADRSYDLVFRAWESLHRFRDVPTLICWGGRDFLFDEDYLRLWIRSLPKAEVCRFADAGHFILEDAGDDVIGLTKRFLERHPA